MTAMTVALLKAKGFTPDRKAGMGSAAVRAALENGQIDVYWEYTGTALGVFNKITDKFDSADAAYKRIKEVDARKGHRLAQHVAREQHVRVRDERRRREEARHRHHERLREGGEGRRQAHVRVERRVLFAPRRPARLAATYGFEFDRDNVKRMDTGLMYQALKDRQVDSARRVRDRRPHPRVQLRRAEGRQELRAAVQHDAGRAQGDPRQEPEARRCAQQRLRRSSTTRRWRSSTRAWTSTRRRRKKWPRGSSRRTG